MISSNSKKKAKVVFCGRPNVGKSSLFNRFVKERRAITDPTPGVTRDPVTGICQINDHEVFLMDTGGYKLDQSGEFDKLVSNRTEAELVDADLIVFLMEVSTVTSEDEAFMKLLRKYDDRVIVAVNKVDTPEKESLVWNFYSYGFSTVVGISAAHNKNIDLLKKEIIDGIDFGNLKNTHRESSSDIKIVVMGKPNAGKSTLANTLSKTSQSLVSEIAGTTRDTIISHFEFNGKTFSLTDTAGIRKKKKVNENIEYYSVNRAIKSIEESDIVLLMVDVEEGLSEQDKKIASLIVNRGKGVVLVLNKWDTMAGIPNQLEAVTDRVRYLFPALSFAPVLPISAKTGEGVDEMLKKVCTVWEQMNKRVETSQLNQALRAWVDDVPPPMVNQRTLKFRYITQVSVNPVRFLLFSNMAKKVPASYLQYIKNNLRKTFGFKWITFVVEVRE